MYTLREQIDDACLKQGGKENPKSWADKLPWLLPSLSMVTSGELLPLVAREHIPSRPREVKV